jgi:hypothetical protein
VTVAVLDWVVLAPLINRLVTTVVRLAVTSLTRPTALATLYRLHNRSNLPVPGGVRLEAARCDCCTTAWNDAASWFFGVVCIDSALFGVGERPLRSHMRGGIFLAVGGSAFAVIARIFHN